MGSDERAREAAAAAALELISEGMTLGLGSGRAVWKLVDAIAGRWAGSPPLRAAVASDVTDERARKAGIEVIELDGRVELDIAFDGADEVDPSLRLLKGGGGALLREKIVIAAARRFVVVAETPKLVERLGTNFRLPVEVVRYGWEDTRRRLGSLLPDAELRREGSEPYLTDEGHYILDCAIPPEADVDRLDPEVELVPGVVEHGLFLGMAERVLLGEPDGGVRVLGAGGRTAPPPDSREWADWQFDRWNANDLDALVSIFAPDAVVIPAENFLEGGQFHGHEQIRAFYSRLHEGWEEGGYGELIDFQRVGDKVLTEIRWGGAGETSGLETFSVWFGVYTLRGDKAVRLQYFDDREEARAAAGLG